MKKGKFCAFSDLAAVLVAAACLCGCESEAKNPVAINPIDINYRFSQIKNEAPRREAADPEIILYKDKYYLFASKSGGYWQSDDLANWQYIKFPKGFPTENYAPTVAEINGEIVFFVSGLDCFWTTSDPENAVWKRVKIDYPRRDTDPALFKDDDGRVYIYYGCSPKDPIMGVEVDPKNNYKMIGEPVALIGHEFKTNGWEKSGENNQDDRSGWNEGANMIKRGGKYYLQYAAPGTQWRNYADGVYVSDKPLGKFVYQKSSPFSQKRGGFIGGAGHGGTFKDKFGNYWHVASMLVGVHHGFERRLGLFPAFFDAKGEMHAIAEFTDRPFEIPQKKFDFSKSAPSKNWNLLSYKKAAKASSSEEKFPPENAADEQIETWWSAKSGNKGERLEIDLGGICKISAIHVNFADEGFNVYDGDEVPIYRYKIFASKDGKSWTQICDESQNQKDSPHSLKVLPKAQSARFVAIENAADMQGGKFSISGLRVFGISGARKPAKVENLEAKRDPADPRNVEISWDETPNAEGYILSWGAEPNKQHSQMTLRQNSFKGSFLNIGSPYYFSARAFNSAGEGKSSDTKEAK
ncbi:MAG: family 43 glycosylhydrolase [Opitutales bacterium]|nr:family 43 glycosylhydrolase [Opitutales bacterium]